MICVNQHCELHGQQITGRNRGDDGSLSARETCPVCGEALLDSDKTVADAQAWSEANFARLEADRLASTDPGVMAFNMARRCPS